MRVRERGFSLTSFLLFLLLWGLLALPGGEAEAHPLDEANIYHFFKCDLNEAGLTLDYRLLVGGIVVYKIWDTLDTDRNKVLSEEEKEAFAKRMEAAVQAVFDEKRLSLTLLSIELPGYEDFIAGTQPFLKVMFQGKWKRPTSGEHFFQLTTNAFPDQSNLYVRPVVEGPLAMDVQTSLVAGQQGFTLAFVIPQSRSLSAPVTLKQKVTVPEKTSVSEDRNAEGPASVDVLASSRNVSKLLSRAQPPSPSLSEEENPARESPAPSPNSADSAMSSFPPSFSLTLDAVSEDSPAPPPPSPALQSLRPYLIGSGGVLIALGLAILLGMGHALLPGHSKAVVGAYLVGARGTIGDAVLLGSVVTLAHTGVVLLFGLLMWRFEKFAPERVQPYLQIGSGLLVALLGLALLLSGLLNWQRQKTEGKETVSDEFDFVPRQGATKRDLLLLGLSGGMVPCADALLLLLFAHAQQKTAFGLLLVLAFGAGMAATLVSVGLLMVRAGDALSSRRSARWERLSRALPVLSAALIFCLGLWLAGAALAQTR